jgi:Uma2 family endonuclease
MRAADYLTAEDLEKIQDNAHRYELVEGRLLVREPAGYAHGRVSTELIVRLHRHVSTHNLGHVLATDTGFILRRGPDTVRAPDASFVSRERIPRPEPRCFAALAPDLAVEILSPSNRPAEIEARVRDLFRAGTRLVWILKPGTETASVRRPGRDPLELSPDDYLDGEDVIPGFRCPLNEIFRDPLSR